MAGRIKSMKVDHPHPCMRISRCATVNTKVRTSSSYPSVDHLDFVLSSNYDHHTQWMVDRPNALKQGRESALFKTPCKKLGKKYEDSQEGDKEQSSIVLPFIGQDKYRNSINHISVSLSSHHLPSTELGYGRKPN